MTTTPQAALNTAVAIAGGQTALAEKLGVGQGHIWNWLYRNKHGVPPEYAPKIEAVTGVSRKKLCPDFPWGAA